MSGRPLDVLEEALDAPVTVTLKDGTAYHGLLAGYDQHMNIVLDAPADPDDVEAVDNTTIIRGDNVVCIKP